MCKGDDSSSENLAGADRSDVTDGTVMYTAESVFTHGDPATDEFLASEMSKALKD